jgi:hypothetical protein
MVVKNLSQNNSSSSEFYFAIVIARNSYGGFGLTGGGLFCLPATYQPKSGVGMKSQNNRSNSIDNKSGIIALLVIVVIGLIVVVWIATTNSWQTSPTSSQGTTNTVAVNSCLDSTWTKLKEQWPDGETKDVNTGHRLTMTYYNDQLDCYAKYNQDSTYDTDVQRLNDKKSDELASYQTQSQTNAARQTNRIICVSNAVGSTAYTNCY